MSERENEMTSWFRALMEFANAGFPPKGKYPTIDIPAMKLNLSDCRHCGTPEGSRHKADCEAVRSALKACAKIGLPTSADLGCCNSESGIPYHELLCGHPEPEKKHGMKLVYVAGPYRAETREGVAQNVAAARHVGRLCVQKGWFPVLPTVNTAHFDHDFPGLADDQYWLDGTMEMMRRCDAVVLVDGWQYSSGAKAEIEEARKMGLKVYMSSNVLPELAKVNA